MDNAHDKKPRGFLFHKASRTWRELLLSGFWRPGFLRYMAHLERLPTIEITSYRLIWVPEDLKVKFTYKTHPFEIDMNFGDLSVYAEDETPYEVFEEIITHLRNYHWVWPWQVLRAGWRYSPDNPLNRHAS